jgi:hypothetical protein
MGYLLLVAIALSFLFGSMFAKRLNKKAWDQEINAKK